MSHSVETYRGVVSAWECDHFGHMNVQFYMARIAAATSSLLGAIALPRQRMRDEHLGFAAVRQEIDYRREALAGDALVMRSAMVSASGRKLILRHGLFDAATGELAAAVRGVGVLIDLKARKSVSVPADVAAAAERIRVPDDHALSPGEAGFFKPGQGWIASQRNAIEAWECDRMGHLNTQFYPPRAAEAEAHLALALGLTPARMRQEGLGLAAHQHRFRFRRELRAGQAVATRTGIVRVDGDELLLSSMMENPDNGELAAGVESVLALTDAEGRQRPWPDDVMAAARRLQGEFTGQAMPPPAAADLPDRPGPAMIETCRAVVQQWETTHHGFAPPRFYLASFSAGAQRLLALAGLDPATMKRERIGNAALDYRVRYGRGLRAGETVLVHSGPLALSERNWTFGHVMTAADGGELLASAAVFNTLFDLDARKSIPLPAGMAARLAPYMPS
jgi:acyl-CoA thioester hydrolase